MRARARVRARARACARVCVGQDGLLSATATPNDWRLTVRVATPEVRAPASHICTRTGLTPAHICTGTGLTPAAVPLQITRAASAPALRHMAFCAWQARAYTLSLRWRVSDQLQVHRAVAARRAVLQHSVLCRIKLSSRCMAGPRAAHFRVPAHDGARDAQRRAEPVVDALVVQMADGVGRE